MSWNIGRKEIEHRSDSANQMSVRYRIIKAERMEQLPLFAFDIAKAADR